MNFIMEHEHLSYPEALKLLAKKYHIEVVETHQTDEDIRQKNDRESMMVVIEYATRYFSRMLLESEEGRDIGISYFKERGFRREIIDRLQLGYSPGQRDS